MRFCIFPSFLLKEHAFNFLPSYGGDGIYIKEKKVNLPVNTCTGSFFTSTGTCVPVVQCLQPNGTQTPTM